MNWQPAYLQTDLIRLQPLKESDFEKLFAVASDPAIWAQHPQKDRYKREVFQTFFDSALQGGNAFLVLEARTGKVIGSSRYYDYNPQEKTIAIGYTFLAVAYWGGAYNKALKKLMLQYAFAFVAAVILHVGVTNFRSQKAVEKLGARKRFPAPINRSGALSFEYIIYKGEPIFGESGTA